MRVGVLGDTHLPQRGPGLPADAWTHLVDCDLLLHAGDVCETALLEELAQWAPVHVAVGNCDPPEVRSWGALDVVHLELERTRVVVVHDSGPASGRGRRLRRRFPEADVIVFGHSHQPLIEREDGLLLVNPGSPTDRRRAPEHTLALLEVDGAQARAELVVVGRR